MCQCGPQYSLYPAAWTSLTSPAETDKWVEWKEYGLQIHVQYKKCQGGNSSGRRPNTNAHIGKYTLPDE